MGSKNRISKYLAPVIQSYITENIDGYLEPFVGGANMIDKINCKNKIGCDIDKYVIATLNGLKNGWIPPYEVSKNEYIDIKNNKNIYSECLVGYIGYELSFGAKWFGGYVKRNDEKHRGDIYSYKSCVKQSTRLKNIIFINKKFQDIDIKEIKNYVIYCDIPYRNTTNYKTDKFPYDEFYSWAKVMSIHNTVLISEYWMPDEFECIWSKECKTLLDSNKSSNDKNNIRVEKLFTYKTN